ncbi:MAG: peptidyl-prolyl cis-trans isomerase [Desulfobacteraceae bacterium]|nr:peptidyl-prolyl cis-trans isomerase [Desulfobacteraceae bacterium]
MKKILPCVYILGLLMIVSPAQSENSKPDVKKTNPSAEIQTSLGSIIVELDRQKAPKTVANFLSYIKDGFYDGTIFHRVIKGFMIQGGGLEPNMRLKKTNDPIRNEADNGLKNTVGAIAMARTNDPDSATSQFFINTVDNNFLDYKAKPATQWGYCVFGRVTKGLDVVKAIENMPTKRGDVPNTPILIKKVQLLKKK